MNQPRGVHPVIGVFKGGGAKGALYSGALRAVGDRDITFSQVAGSSAGAITAAFVAAGATPEDLRRFEAGGRHLLDQPSGVTGALNLRNRLGILSFHDLRQWIADCLTGLYQQSLKGGTVSSLGPTFAQMRDAGAIPLHIAGADLHWRAPVVFNSELTPDLSVADAAAASSAIPFVFETPFITGSAGLKASDAVLVSDGGVMANLPIFIFHDSGYRAVAGLDPAPTTDPIVGFTFVDRETPQHTTGAGTTGDAYRARYGKATGATTVTLATKEALYESGFDVYARRLEPKANKPRTGGSAVRRAAFRVLELLLRVVELVLLPPINWLLRLASNSRSPSVADRSRNPRLQRWLRFGDRVFDLAPGYVIAGMLLLVPVLMFGIPDVVAYLWPDWSDLFADQGLGGSLFRGATVSLYLLLAVSGLLVVVVLVMLGLVAYVAGWVVKPIAVGVGPHLVATFMRNPQEPAWAGSGDREVIIRLMVPEGWTLLKSTDSDEKMCHELELVRASVAEQLELAKLGTSPVTQAPDTRGRRPLRTSPPIGNEHIAPHPNTES